MRRFLVISVVASLTAWTTSICIAQDVDMTLKFDPKMQGSFDPAPELDIGSEPNYQSRPIGKRQRWRLERGEFTSEPAAPGDISDPALDSYSGLRLRLPSRR